MKKNISLIIGLGNPGKQYEATRHNAGQWLIERLVEQYHCEIRLENKFKGQIGRFNSLGHDCYFLIPNTFMNLSGQAVAAMAHFYKISPHSILVAHDDLDLEPGTLRLKFDGGHGGHNGLRDITAHMGSDYYRIRIGIGHPGVGRDVSGYVLSPPSKNEKESIEHAFNRLTPRMDDLLTGQFEAVMNYLHSKAD
jgi:peptidyl-tRNA hydrolase, PTH1 family